MSKPIDWCHYGFYALVQELERKYGHEILETTTGPVRFAPVSHLGFSPNDIDHAEQTQDQLVVRLGFLGLTGASSPLPGYLLNPLAQEKEEYRALQGLLELFNHRLYGLLYMSWQKHRPWTMDHAKPLFAIQAKPSAHSIAQQIKSVFQLSSVSIQCFTTLYVDIPQPLLLGCPERRLGMDTLLGQKANVQAHHFTVTIQDVPSTRFHAVLRGDSSWIMELQHFIKSQMSNPLSFTIRLEETLSDWKMTTLSGCLLGAESWLGMSPSEAHCKEFHFV